MTPAPPRLSRRAILAGGAGLAAVACVAGGYELVRDGTLPGQYTLARMTGACGPGLAPPDGPLPSSAWTVGKPTGTSTGTGTTRSA
jgi:hypothetical protein